MVNGDFPPEEDERALNQTKPFRFLVRLYQEVGGLSPEDLKKGFLKTYVIPQEHTATRGAVGSGLIHFCWREQTSLLSETARVQVETKTFGLPGLDVEWKFSFKRDESSQNQLHHGSIRCGFRESADEARFKRIWNEIFGRVPTFERSQKLILDWDAELKAIHKEYKNGLFYTFSGADSAVPAR